MGYNSKLWWHWSWQDSADGTLQQFLSSGSYRHCDTGYPVLSYDLCVCGPISSKFSASPITVTVLVKVYKHSPHIFWGWVYLSIVVCSLDTTQLYYRHQWPGQARLPQSMVGGYKSVVTPDTLQAEELFICDIPLWHCKGDNYIACINIKYVPTDGTTFT